MYKSIIYFNSEDSIHKFQNKLLSSNLFDNIKAVSLGKKEIVYKNSEVIISIRRKVVSYLVYNQNNVKVISAIYSLEN